MTGRHTDPGRHASPGRPEAGLKRRGTQGDTSVDNVDTKTGFASSAEHRACWSVTAILKEIVGFRSMMGHGVHFPGQDLQKPRAA